LRIRRPGREDEGMTDTDWMRPGDGREPVDLRTDQPHPARVYNYLLGGKDYFEADARAARQSLEKNPDALIPPRTNRDFMTRAVTFLAKECAIKQYLDIGTGIPASPNVHETAQGVHSDARIVYVDNDPIVLNHARALLRGTPEGQTKYIEADIRQPEDIVAQATKVLDPSAPVALFLISVLHFIGEDENPQGIVDRLLAPWPSGSYVAISHLTDEFNPEMWAFIAKRYEGTDTKMIFRTRERGLQFFERLLPVEPGLVMVHRWRPEPGDDVHQDSQVACWGCVARKP
jgi:hypothetical protein